MRRPQVDAAHDPGIRRADGPGILAVIVKGRQDPLHRRDARAVLVVAPDHGPAGKGEIALRQRLADRRVTVKLDAKAKEWVAEKGYDPVFGARPLKRFLQRHLETRLARALIGGEVGEGAELTYTVKNGELAPVGLDAKYSRA